MPKYGWCDRSTVRPVVVAMLAMACVHGARATQATHEVSAIESSSATVSTGMTDTLDMSGRSAVDTPPVPRAGNPGPRHPTPDAMGDNQGIVEYRVDVAADGSPTKVTIVSVTPGSTGLDAAARETLAAWRFAPATSGGVAVPGAFEGRFAFVETLPPAYARTYPVEREALWRALVSTFESLGIEIEANIPAEGILRSAIVSSEAFPGVERRVERTAGVDPLDFVVHAFVPPSANSSRVYVDTQLRAATDRHERTLFEIESLGALVFEELERHSGVRGWPVAVEARFREEAALPIDGRPVCDSALDERAADASGDLPPMLVDGGFVDVHHDEQRWRSLAVALSIEARVQEDGRISGVEILRGVGGPTSTGVVARAVSQWRLRPARRNGCLVPGTFRARVELGFEPGGLRLVGSTGTHGRDLYDAIRDSDLATVRALHEAGASLVEPSFEGETPLRQAARHGHREIVAWILEQGVEVDAPPGEPSALHEAAAHGHLECAALLVEHGGAVDAPADVILVDRLESSFAFELREATPLILASRGDDADVVRYLVASGADVDASSGSGLPPISYALYNGNPDVVAALVVAGADAADIKKALRLRRPDVDLRGVIRDARKERRRLERERGASEDVPEERPADAP